MTHDVCLWAFVTCVIDITHICLSYRVVLFSESSSQALSVFNKVGLLDMVVQCLERHPHNVELAISAGRSEFFSKYQVQVLLL